MWSSLVVVSHSILPIHWTATIHSSHMSWHGTALVPMTTCPYFYTRHVAEPVGLWKKSPSLLSLAHSTHHGRFCDKRIADCEGQRKSPEEVHWLPDFLGQWIGFLRAAGTRHRCREGLGHALSIMANSWVIALLGRLILWLKWNWIYWYSMYTLIYVNYNRGE